MLTSTVHPCRDEAVQEAPDKKRPKADSADGGTRPPKAKGLKKAASDKSPSVSSQEDIRDLRISKVEHLRALANQEEGQDRSA